MPETPPPWSQTRRPRKGRKSRISSIGLIVTLGLCMVTSDTLAAPASPADAAQLRTLELQDQMQATLSARMAAQIDRMLQETTDRQLATMREQLDPPQKLARQIEARTERHLAALTLQAGRDSLASARGRETGQAADDDPATRMETGSLALGPQVLDHSSSESARMRHRFARPFTKAPHVAVGVRVVHLSSAEQPRVAVRVVAVDEAGFDYEVRTWGSPKESDLRANWVAYDDPRKSASAPASRR